MDLRQWSRSNVEYGRELLSSGIDGARAGRAAFLDGESLAPFLNDSVRGAVIPAALGAFIGVLGSCSAYRRKSIGKSLAFGLLGGAIGLGAGFVWESRQLTASATDGALKNIARVRDERWFKNHPIDYA